METITDRIRNRRIELGLSQDQLAHRMGYHSRSSINKIESGKNQIPLPKVKELAKALDTTPAYLLGITPDDMKANNKIIVMNRGGKAIQYNLPEEQMEKAERLIQTLYHEYMSDDSEI